jgi:hypothetical protein
MRCQVCASYWTISTIDLIWGCLFARRIGPHARPAQMLKWACSDGMARRRSDGVLLGIADTEVR